VNTSSTFHGDDGTDAREAVEHEGDQRLVAQIDVRGAAGAVKQGAHFGRIEDRRLPLRTTGRDRGHQAPLPQPHVTPRSRLIGRVPRSFDLGVV
jgi:hypothetical protein